VPHRKCGKLVVATDATEMKRLEAILAQARINGVEGVDIIDGAAAKRLEPELACVAAMRSPETGIVDSHRYMLALQGDLEDRGGVVALNTPIEHIVRKPGGWKAHFGGIDPQAITVDAVVNSAGLGAQKLGRATEGYPAERVPPLFLGKGSYFSFAGRPAFSRLIYPVPIPGGLGVHVTLDMAGRMRFGPDVEWVGEENYDVDPSRAAAFYARIRDYWPRLPDNGLVPDYCGIRPKLTGPNEPAVDFMIDGPREHGLPGLVHLFGIESPGLTSALSLAEDVTKAISL
jgi:L-2-hydroxyglutarate oxidase LhgO